ncbi:MAG: hypothetical protein SFX73_11320 [Kofleriaceae bacterium]|nr:hypothetical protein [Kofleriaceae bacterium]
MRSRLHAPLLSFATLVAACNDSSVGDDCTSSTPCDQGLACWDLAPGGVCTAPCSTLGSQVECPEGSACTMVEAQLRCLATCQSGADCRLYFECEPIAGAGVSTCTFDQP